jgi:predicted short-subunit dehydrogenase-like oxidoreductase (DUF2520 family)
MAPATLWGLAAAGNISQSLLMRVPQLKHKLGPVASSSYRLASRIVNTLRAGTAVRTAAELQSTNVILLCVPGVPLTQLVGLSFVEEIQWQGKTVLICDTAVNGEISADLRLRGASVATLNSVPGLPASFLISGDRASLKLARTLVRSVAGGIIEIAPEHLVLFDAAVTLASSLFTSLLETAVECLRQSGLDQPLTGKTVDLLFQHSLRSFKHSGRKSWSGPVANGDRDSIDAQIRALKQCKPRMASYFSEAAHFSFELYQTFPELTRYKKERWREFQKSYPNRS